MRKIDVLTSRTRLFSPYVQTEIGRRQGGKGTGLGLAFVRQIVQLNKGRLGVNSEYGKGSTFWLELPFQLKRGSTSISNTHDSYPSTRTFIGSTSTNGKNGPSAGLQPMVDNVVTDAPGMMRATDHAPEPPSTPVANRQNDEEQGHHVRAISDSTFSDTATLPMTPITPRTGVEPINVLIVDDDQ
jgi:hypothetical protein